MSEKITLKVVMEDHHIGPSARNLSRIAIMSKAAGKIGFNQSVKLVRAAKAAPTPEASSDVSQMNLDKASANTSQAKKNTTVLSYEMDNTPEALKFTMLLANIMESSDNHVDYTKKMSAFESARNTVMEGFGLPVGPDSGSNSLTAAQREVYNDAMSKYAFDYKSVRIHIKVGTDRTVKTKSIRMLHGTAEGVWNNVSNAASKQMKNHDVLPRTNAKVENTTSSSPQ